MDMEIEGLKLKGISIKDLLLPEFIKSLEKAKINLNAVSLVFIMEEGNEKKKIVTPFVLNHQNSQEIKEKILHINGEKEKELKSLVEIIKKIK